MRQMQLKLNENRGNVDNNDISAPTTWDLDDNICILEINHFRLNIAKVFKINWKKFVKSANEVRKVVLETGLFYFCFQRFIRNRAT